MKAISLLIPAIAAAFAGNTTTNPVSGTEERQLLESVEKTLAQFQQLAGEENVAAAPNAPGRIRAGLQSSSLVNGALQPASGLDSNALGLTSPEAWRRTFPRKHQR